MRIIIMQGVAGSGKTTFIRKNYPEAVSIFSADHYFMHAGKYVFNPADLPKAHAACLRDYTRYIQAKSEHDSEKVFVDNTNTTVAEIAPYYALAQAYGHEVEIVRLLVAPDLAAARNTHGVPATAVWAMHDRIVASQSQMPPWWKDTLFTEE